MSILMYSNKKTSVSIYKFLLVFIFALFTSIYHLLIGRLCVMANQLRCTSKSVDRLDKLKELEWNYTSNARWAFRTMQVSKVAWWLYWQWSNLASFLRPKLLSLHVLVCQHALLIKLYLWCQNKLQIYKGRGGGYYKKLIVSWWIFG